MLTVKSVRYLLVWVDTFTGWVKAIPNNNKRAQTQSNLLLSKISPCFEIPASFQLNNGSEFTTQISKLYLSPQYPLAFP